MIGTRDELQRLYDHTRRRLITGEPYTELHHGIVVMTILRDMEVNADLIKGVAIRRIGDFAYPPEQRVFAREMLCERHRVRRTDVRITREVTYANMLADRAWLVAVSRTLKDEQMEKVMLFRTAVRVVKSFDGRTLVDLERMWGKLT